MNKKQFESLCHNCGYADKSTVQEYCKNRDEFSDTDVVAIYRIFSANKIGLTHTECGIKTTKCDYEAERKR